jgi:hypothetical protein
MDIVHYPMKRLHYLTTGMTNQYKDKHDKQLIQTTIYQDKRPLSNLHISTYKFIQYL